MSVKIEILDYAYKSIESEQMVVDSSFDSGAGWTITPAGSWVVSGGNAQKISGTGAGYLRQSMTFQEGQRYRIKYKISGLTTSGSLVLANHLVGGANGFSKNVNGTFTWDWIQGSSNLDKLSLWGSSTFDGKVEYAKVYHLSNIDWDNSVVGELDVTDHSDFPLALTFQISDFKDLTSTSGDYSKTFKVPATKNNNNILKHLYIPNISIDNELTNKKPCRILFNNLYSLVGLIQVDGVGGYGETPSYYNCVFFGSNLSWASKIQDTYMDYLEWGVEGDNLTYNKDSIMATWQYEDCANSSNSPIVYPVTSYGNYNEEGEARTIQLLDTQYGAIPTVPSDRLGYYGFENSGNPYGTPPPVSDWRPSVFVKTTLDKIFSQINGNGNAGYQINSDFMNTDMFKKLVWLLPNFKYNNPDERVTKYSVRSSFENGVKLDASPVDYPQFSVQDEGVQMFFHGLSQTTDPVTQNYYYSGEGREVLDIQSANLTVSLNNGSYVDMANNYVTIGEYGNYSISVNGLKSKLALGFKGGGVHKDITEMNTRVNLEVQTVGQDSWVIVDYGINQLNPTNDAGGTGVNSSTDSNSQYKDIGDISLERYFNKGDKIRLTLGMRLYGSINQTFFIYTFFNSTSNSSFNIEINPEHVAYGQTYNLKDVISSDYKQIDFVKGVAHAFNLQMTTDESTKTVNIEPFDSFYKPYGDAIDWTYKLDRSSETSDKWLQSDLKKTLIFKYKSDDKDLKVKRRGEDWFDNIQDEYPYREILPDTFKKGESEFENPFFAGTFNGKDADTTLVTGVDTAYSAILWDGVFSPSDLARPEKGYEFLPRLLYWNKYSPTGVPSLFSNFGMRKFAAVQTWSSNVKYLAPNADFAPQGGLLSNVYPQATMVNRDSTTSPNLAYGNAWVRDYDDATGVYTAYQSGEGLYDTYYRNMIEGLKRSPRLRTVSVSLNITDIVNLDFTKLVYIDGVYWRINRIIDYKPNKNESTKVELIEWFQIGVFTSTAPMFGSSGSSAKWGQAGSNETNENIGL